MSNCSKCVYEKCKCVGKRDESEKEVFFYTCHKGHDVDATRNCKDYKKEML